MDGRIFLERREEISRRDNGVEWQAVADGGAHEPITKNGFIEARRLAERHVVVLVERIDPTRGLAIRRVAHRLADVRDDLLGHLIRCAAIRVIDRQKAMESDSPPGRRR